MALAGGLWARLPAFCAAPFAPWAPCPFRGCRVPFLEAFPRGSSRSARGNHAGLELILVPGSSRVFEEESASLSLGAGLGSLPVNLLWLPSWNCYWGFGNAVCALFIASWGFGGFSPFSCVQLWTVGCSHTAFGKSWLRGQQALTEVPRKGICSPFLNRNLLINLLLTLLKFRVFVITFWIQKYGMNQDKYHCTIIKNKIFLIKMN